MAYAAYQKYMSSYQKAGNTQGTRLKCALKEKIKASKIYVFVTSKTNILKIGIVEEERIAKFVRFF